MILPSGAQRFVLHGGVGTIGGTKLEVARGDARLMFDFGAAFEPGKGAFDHDLRPRPGAAALDHVAMGIAPALPGLYPEAFTLPDGRRVEGAQTPLPVFVTHLHLDHVSLLPLLAPHVPVHMTRDSIRLAGLLEDVGEGIGEHDLRPVDEGEALRYGDLSVRAVPVDHDIPGTAAYVVDGPGGRLAYSGDVRGHGRAPELNDAFVAELEERPAGTLLLEGTRLSGGPPGLPESHVGPTVAALLESASGAAISFYPRNVERMRALAEAAATAGRRLALTPASFHVMRGWFGDETLRGLHVVAYRGPAAPEPLPKVAATFARADKARPEDIRERPEAFLVELPYAELTSLASGLLPPGSVYIHSDGVPLGPFDPAFANLDVWLARFGLRRVDVRSSGHADAQYLRELVERIAPVRLYAIHSTAPERLPVPASGIRILPAVGTPYLW